MKLLLALDGSSVSERAAAGISSWARSSGVDLVLLSVFDADDVHATTRGGRARHELTPHGTFSGTPLGIRDVTPGAAEDRSQALARAHSEREAYLHGIARQYFEGLEPSILVVSGDDPADAIVEAAGQTGADVVAVGSHGRSGISHALLGSIAERVMRASPVPVLVIGPAVAVESTG